MTLRYSQNMTEPTPSRYRPEEVERILAQANDLQDAHRQTLDEAQIQAVAAEVGIGPEFVRAALEQEKSGVAPVPLSRVVRQTKDVATPAGGISVRRAAATIAAYGVLATLVLALGKHSNDFGLLYLFAFVIPAFLALGLGAGSESRRRGLVSGAALGATAVAAVEIGVRLGGGNVPTTTQDIQIFLLMFVTGTVLGTIGAEARRQVRKVVQRLQVSPP